MLSPRTKRCLLSLVSVCPSFDSFSLCFILFGKELGGKNPRQPQPPGKVSFEFFGACFHRAHIEHFKRSVDCIILVSASNLEHAG